jgi:alpha-beta hydrolase superfamily lysophospholipase
LNLSEKGALLKGILSWPWRHPWRAGGLSLLLAFLLLNVLTYQHARAMLTFRADVNRTPTPEALSALDKLTVLTCGVTIPRPENTRSPKDFGMPFETLSFASADGTQLEGWLLTPPNPKGTIAFFHGYAACRATLLDEAKAVHTLGFVALLIDFRGSGGSEGSSTSLGFYEAEDVVATVKLVRERQLPTPLILYGQSMGGAAVLRTLATQDVLPDGVILESVFGRMLETVRNRFALMGVPAFPGAELLVFWGGAQLGYSGFSHNPEEYARSCQCPTLLLHGSEDRHARLEEAKAILENLAGEKELVVFEGAGHKSLASAAPAQWREAVETFLMKHQAKRGTKE